MNQQKVAYLPDRETDLHIPGWEANRAAMRWREEERLAQWGCTSCMHYEPRSIYCTFIHAPVWILFTCPMVLDNGRSSR